jgi:aminoglycoside 6'-N-acetyltransferase
VSFRPARIVSADDPALTLEALTEAGLPQLRSWLAAPHLAQAWNPPDEGVAEIASHLAMAHIAPYLIVEAGRPIGYLQVYHANPDEFWALHDLPRETYGLDLFIGPPELVGRGLGTRAVRLAVRHLSALPDAARLHIDPTPDNAAAIRVYEKAGFRRAGEIETPDGRSLYMILEPRRAILGGTGGGKTR